MGLLAVRRVGLGLGRVLAGAGMLLAGGLVWGQGLAGGGEVSGGAPQKLLDGLSWREVGPYRGGRSVAVSGVPGKAAEFYMGTTGGGVWKTTDTGETWSAVSDGFFGSGSIGAIGVSASRPETVYVGTGEHAVRGNITHGDGVYRSDDGGRTWRHLGLAETQYISRVVVHPTDPETVWVAAIGPVFRSFPGLGDQTARGVYKSTDGGKSWRQTLFVSDRAGAVDLSMDLNSPDVMYAATWEVWRTPWTLNSGGPGSKLWKSVDGGENWVDISGRPGLPRGLMGRIGVSVSRADSARVYAMIESAEGGLYASDDSGATWRLVNGDSAIRQRPWYYTRVYADPVEKDTVYVLNVAYHKSVDGGRTFRSGVAQHVDHHDLWIDPSDNRRMVIGNDGGASVSVNGGAAWTAQDYPTAQFYHVTVDNAFPYNVLGAQQDNSTVRLASRTRFAGIRAEDWTSTAGGESGWVVAHPQEPWVVVGGSYGGTLQKLDHLTRISRSIDPWPDNPMGSGAAGLTHRFNWTFPLHFSPHAPYALYAGSQHVLRSRDLGASWEVISPDLTTNDKAKQGPSGGPITRDNTSVEYYCTVVSIAESPLRAGVIWAGTDDGLLHVSTDDGLIWRNVTPPGMPEGGALVSLVEASAHEAGTAYVAVTNYKNGDFRPFVFVTRDLGRSWSLVAEGIPADVFVRAVREDPEVRGLLYAGTERGVYVRYPGAGAWQRMNGTLPVVPVHNLAVKGTDLVVATHGRSFWVLDDLDVVRQLAGLGLNRIVLARPAESVAARFGLVGGAGVGKNPAGYGVKAVFHLPYDVDEAVVEMLDGSGFVVSRQSVRGAKSGLNRAYLWPSYPGYRGFRGMRMWAGFAGGLKAPPGDYRVRLLVRGQTLEQPVVWSANPLTEATAADLQEQYRLSREIADSVTEANSLYVRARDTRAAVEKAMAGDRELEREGRLLARKLELVEEGLHQARAESSQDFLNHPIRLNNRLAALLGTVQGSDFGPTAQSVAVFRVLRGELTELRDRLLRIEGGDLVAFEVLLGQKGRGRLEVQVEELGPARGGGVSGFETSGE